MPTPWALATAGEVIETCVPSMAIVPSSGGYHP
jgi:hypothetical protein